MTGLSSTSILQRSSILFVWLLPLLLSAYLSSSLINIIAFFQPFSFRFKGPHALASAVKWVCALPCHMRAPGSNPTRGTIANSWDRELQRNNYVGGISYINSARNSVSTQSGGFTNGLY